MRIGGAACLWLACHAAIVSAAVDPVRLARIDALIEQAIGDGRLPGAVVLVGHGGEVVYERAFGARSLAAETPEPMTVDTVFDLASLTKVVATTTSVMILVEEGRLRLRDRVADHVPGFAGRGRPAGTIGQLLAHLRSGARPPARAGLRGRRDRDCPYDRPASGRGPRRAVHLQRPELHAAGRDRQAGQRAASR